MKTGIITFPDIVHGTVEIPAFLRPILNHKLAQRSHNINMAIIPNRFISHGNFQTRRQHGNGVCHLMTLALRANDEVFEAPPELYIAALVHDDSSPPFSHLTEPWLRDLFKVNGEGFFTQMAERFGMDKLLRKHNYSLELIQQLISGATPMAKILHGCVDVDNLDNLLRYTLGLAKPTRLYCPKTIAESYRWVAQKNEWAVQPDIVAQLKAWQRQRAQVYGEIYQTHRLRGISMLQRAISIEHAERGLTEEFFYLTDHEATSYLENSEIKEVRRLMENLGLWEWYVEAINLDTPNPSAALLEAVKSFKEVHRLSDEIAVRLAAEPYEVCLYVLRGKDFRRLTLPIVNSSEAIENEDTQAIYRCRLFIHPRLQEKTPLAKEIVQSLLA